MHTGIFVPYVYVWCWIVLSYHPCVTQASFTPFLAESLYKNLRNVVPAEDRAESVHFLMVPQPREELIDTTIESAVSRMQSVIELGRVCRDRRTLPVKV